MAKRQVAMGCARGGDNMATWVAYSDAINPGTGKWSGDIALRYDQLDKPLHWKDPRRIFVCSMSDLFHPKVPFDFIDKIFFQISFCPQHTFLILTKRPKIMLEYITQLYEGLNIFHHGKKFQWPFRNIHLGVSISNQAEADEKIPILLQIPTAVRWLSIEPMLEGIDLWKAEYPTPDGIGKQGALTGWPGGIDWVVVGGESGLGARPMHPDWVRNIRDQCVAAGVPFFFKQWGVWLPISQMTKEQESINKLKRVTDVESERFFRFGKKKAGRLLDGKEWNQYPERR